MIVRILAILFGVAFVFTGVAGFIPQLMENGLLFGFFEVGLVNNLFHVVVGIIAIMSGTNFKSSKVFFIVFGIIYAIVGIVGFWREGDLYLAHTNTADNIFYIVVAIIWLLIGFSAKSRR